MKLLTFLLAGPLAGYGESSRWDRRDTADMVTKSAVVGLLGCCMGIPRGDSRLNTLDRALRMGVRRERRGSILIDYQTVTGNQGVILNAQGEKRRGSTIVTPKQYLQDSMFQVFLCGEASLLEKCAQAMRRPRWVACLGRRGAVPSYPILPYIIEADSLNEAVRQWRDPVLCGAFVHVKRDAMMRCEIEIRDQSEAVDAQYTLLVRNDSAVSADKNRYAERTVCVFSVEGGEACT